MNNTVNNLVYAFYDDVAEHVLNYYICPDPVWAERIFKTLLEQITCGQPHEFSFRLIGSLDDLLILPFDEVVLHCQKNEIHLVHTMKGVDYYDPKQKKVADNV